jgi:uncharacterized phosphosugar-binding protein
MTHLRRYLVKKVYIFSNGKSNFQASTVFSRANGSNRFKEIVEFHLSFQDKAPSPVGRGLVQSLKKADSL